MGLSYEKYREIVNNINNLANELKEQGEETYKSFKVEDISCQLIGMGNSLNAYLRHAKKQKQ